MKKLLATLLALLLALSAPVLAEEMLLESLETSAVEGDTPISPAEEAPVAEEEADLVDEIEVSEIFAVADAPADVATETVTDKQSLTLNVGETRQLAVEGKTIKSCKSSKKSVASVSKAGLVTAKKVGTTKITVAFKDKNSKKIKLTVNVIDPSAPASVSITGDTSVTMTKGDTLQLSAVLAPEGAQSKLTWKSSNKKIASVNSGGLVTAKKVGKAKIVVKTHNGKKASIKVTVTKAAPNPSGRTEMSAYFGQNLEKTAKKFNLRWSSKSSPTGYYTNKFMEMGWGMEKYWEEAELEYIIIKQDPKGKYSLYGVYLGMSTQNALDTLAQQGFTQTSSGKGKSWFSDGLVTFNAKFSKGAVKQIYAEKPSPNN